MIDAVTYRKLLEAIHGIGMSFNQEEVQQIATVIQRACTRLLAEEGEDDV